MSKKKKLLYVLLSLAVLIAVQIYSLMSYDHFKAEGGMKIEMAIDQNDVTRDYARASLDFDYVMKDAIRTHKSDGGDFLTILAKSNKKRLKKPLVLLLNYKEIEELSIDSKDEDVVEFLRADLDRDMGYAADLYISKIQRAINNTADVSFDSKELTMIIKLPGVMDSLNPESFNLPQVNLGFYECIPMGAFANFWHSACQMSQPEPIEGSERKLSEGISIVEIDNSKRSLANCVVWQDQGIGVVKPEDKAFVDSLIHSEDVDELFPGNYKFAWSQKTNWNRQGDLYYLYLLRIPESGKATISNEDIRRTEFEADGGYGQPVLGVKMTPEGTDKWAEMTAKNVNRIIAMSVNGVVFSAPNVINPITDGNTQITGGDPEELKDIEIGLNLKSLEIHPIESSMSFEKGNPPILNATIQKILIGISILLFLFFSVSYIRNFRTN